MFRVAFNDLWAFFKFCLAFNISLGIFIAFSVGFLFREIDLLVARAALLRTLLVISNNIDKETDDPGTVHFLRSCESLLETSALYVGKQCSAQIILCKEFAVFGAETKPLLSDFEGRKGRRTDDKIMSWCEPTSRLGKV